MSAIKKNTALLFALEYTMLGFPGGSAIKNPLVMQDPQETRVQSLSCEDPQRKAWQPTPVFLPGESPRTEEPGRPPFKGSQRVRYN